MPDTLSNSQMSKLIEAFNELKAENDRFLRERFEQTFVGTAGYESAKMAGKTLVVGGKGSGKTAILYAHKVKNRERYLAVADISIDQLPFTAIFNFFFDAYTRTAAKMTVSGTELQDLLEIEKITSYAWRNALLAIALLQATEALCEGGDLTPRERIDIEGVRNDLRHMCGRGPVEPRSRESSSAAFAFLYLFFAGLQEVVEKIIDQSYPTVAMLLANLLEALIKKTDANVEDRLSEYARPINEVLDRLGKRAFISLDRFDDYYDKFYAEIHPSGSASANGETFRKKQFLRSILEGLVLAARDIKGIEQYRNIDALIAVPQDKFVELELRERMDLERRRVTTVSWSPTELFSLVNHRIHAALSLNGPIDKAWYEVFPREVKNGATGQAEDTFLYLVRHSQWKPREIQMHVTELLERIRRNEGRQITEDQLRECVRSSCGKIVQQEFRVEFAKEYPGLHQLLNKLMSSRKTTVMPYDAVCDLVKGVSLADDVSTADDVLKRMYKMGLVGARLERNNFDRLAPTVVQGHIHILYRFNYNSPDTSPFASNSTVVFHPMFFDVIGAAHTEDFIVHELRWEMYYSA